MGDSSFYDATDGVNKILWWAGWRAKETIGGLFVAGLVLGFVYEIGILTVAGLFGGVGLWYLGTREINEKYGDLEEGFIADAKLAAKGMLGMGGDVKSYSLMYASGAALLVNANRFYHKTTLVVGETSVAVHDVADLDMVNLNEKIGNATQELYFDQIGSVNYDAPHFQIKTADGDVLQYQSSRKPDDALYDLQQRIRAYKSKQISN